MAITIEYHPLDLNKIDEENVIQLYEDVGWANYLKEKAQLINGIKNSDSVLGAYHRGELVGLIRLINDKCIIVYIQDILVKQKYQRKGIGRELVKQGLEKYSKVRQKVLLTDNEESLKNFYQKIGFKEVNELHLSCFVKIS